MTIFSASLTKRMIILIQSYDSSHHVAEANCPSHLLLQHTVVSTDHLVSQKWPGGILIIFWLLMCHSSMKGSARILAPPPLQLQKHTELRVHNFAHSSHLWQEPRLANCSYAWSQRLCRITLTIHYFNPLSHALVIETGGIDGVNITTHNWTQCS
jgi:hypothetical protein